MADVDNFRQLLQYFVAHLEFCYANDVKGWNGETPPLETGTRGYKEFIDNKSWNTDWKNKFKRNGTGYKDHKIQTQISDWDKYSTNKIHITVSNFRGGYQSKSSNYLHWDKSENGIRASKWDSVTNTIIELIITTEKKDYKPIATINVIDNLYDKTGGVISSSTPDLQAFWGVFNGLRYTSFTNFPTLDHPLNLILYGPPGTGKTYNTLFHALAIIENKSIDDLIEKKCPGKTSKDNLTEDEYKLFKDDFDRYVDEGRIVFTTFHQSMSYEDFIEGIKPVVEGTEMTYDVLDGLFKELCERASSEYSASNFDICYDNFVSGLSGRKKLSSVKGNDFYVDVNSKGNLNLYTTAKQNKNGTLTKEKIKQTYVGKMDYYKGYMMGVIKHLEDHYGLTKPQKLEERGNYVLIIDEINRGNVSQIFGELITLIEKDKRLCEKEAMTATLPYSQKPFGVPNNLYIIGTMNTADRSVEALDTALRRRFSFEEMMPKPNLLKDGSNTPYAINAASGPITLEDILDKINARIELLKDREHKIGHSYFMGYEKASNKEEWLKKVFKDNIIPLLQEYFYGDYKKIYYVLGNGFVEDENNGKKEDAIRKELFPHVKDQDDDIDIPEEKYEIKPWDKIDIIAALEELIGRKKVEAEPSPKRSKPAGETA